MVIMRIYRLIIKKQKPIHAHHKYVNMILFLYYDVIIGYGMFFLTFNFFHLILIDGKTGFMTRSMKRKARQLAAKQRNNDQSLVARHHLISRPGQNAHNQEITSQNHQGMNRARSGKPQGRREEEKDKRNCKSNFYDTCVKSVFDKHEVYNNATIPVFIK